MSESAITVYVAAITYVIHLFSKRVTIAIRAKSGDVEANYSVSARNADEALELMDKLKPGNGVQEE